jgi:RHS repeat-associated protein
LSGDTFTSTERYLWEGDSYYDPLVYQVYNNARYYPLFDGLGSTRQLLDESQTVTDSYSYEAFGNLMASTGSTPNPYKYVGSLGYYQTGSSLMHLGARYYMPELGRFTSQDPVKPAGDMSRAWSSYGYSSPNPVIHVDPAGENPVVVWTCIASCGVVAAILAAAYAGCRAGGCDRIEGYSCAQCVVEGLRDWCVANPWACCAAGAAFGRCVACARGGYF